MMRTMRRFAAAALAALVGATASALAPAAEATTEHRSADGTVSVRLPASWTVAPAPPEEVDNVIRLDATLPDGKGSVAVWVYRRASYRSERGRVARDYPENLRIYEAKRGEVRTSPPHFWVDDERDPARPLRRCFAPRILRRGGHAVLFAAHPSLWETVEPAYLEAVRTLTTTAGEVPPRPDGYRSLLRDGYEYLLHPKAREADVDPIHAVVLAAERDFATVHGVPEKSPGNPVQILLHPSAAVAAASTPANAWNDWGVHDEPGAGRLWTAPLPKEPAGRAEFDACFRRVLHFGAYDGARPLWMYWGEAKRAAAETLAGKPFPAVAESLLPSIPRDAARLARFDELAGMDYDALRRLNGHLLVYLAFFRQGPKAYRDAWDAFVREMASSRDAARAQEMLLVLDQDLLRRDASAWAAKSLRPVKGR